MHLSEPELIRADHAARLCGVSRVTWLRWRSAGKIPDPIRIGRTVLWSKTDIVRWIAARCPDASTWRAMGRGNGEPAPRAR